MRRTTIPAMLAGALVGAGMALVPTFAGAQGYYDRGRSDDRYSGAQTGDDRSYGYGYGDQQRYGQQRWGDDDRRWGDQQRYGQQRRGDDDRRWGDGQRYGQQRWGDDDRRWSDQQRYGQQRWGGQPFTGDQPYGPGSAFGGGYGDRDWRR